MPFWHAGNPHMLLALLNSPCRAPSQGDLSNGTRPSATFISCRHKARAVSCLRSENEWMAARIYEGSAQVTEGSGRMLVVAVGVDSEWGRTMALVATDAQPTPLQVLLPGLIRPSLQDGCKPAGCADGCRETTLSQACLKGKCMCLKRRGGRIRFRLFCDPAMPTHVAPGAGLRGRL